MIVKASKNTEAGVMPSTPMLTTMGRCNEEMVKAAVMQAGDGLHPTSKRARIEFAGTEPKVTEARFAVTADLIAGFWLIEVKSKDEAIAWIKRAPFDGGAEIENPSHLCPEDFGDALTPELRDQGERLRGSAVAS